MTPPDYSSADHTLTCVMYFADDQLVALRTWAPIALSILKDSGFPADVVHTTHGKPPYRIQNFRPIARKADFYKSVSGDPDRLLDGWLACAITFDQCLVISLPHRGRSFSSMLPIMIEVGRSIPFAYGIVFSMRYERGPEFYAVGMSRASRRIEAWESGTNNIEWFRNWRQFREGKIRDVYPVNILNATQLAAMVGHQSLGAWIGADSRRGTLSGFPTGLSTWQVPSARIAAVRRELSMAGILISYPPGSLRRNRIKELLSFFSF